MPVDFIAACYQDGFARALRKSMAKKAMTKKAMSAAERELAEQMLLGQKIYGRISQASNPTMGFLHSLLPGYNQVAQANRLMAEGMHDSPELRHVYQQIGETAAPRIQLLRQLAAGGAAGGGAGIGAGLGSLFGQHTGHAESQHDFSQMPILQRLKFIFNPNMAESYAPSATPEMTTPAPAY